MRKLQKKYDYKIGNKCIKFKDHKWNNKCRLRITGGQSDVTKSKWFINLSDGAYLQAEFSFIDAETI